MARKIVNNTDPGTSTVFGGEDIDYINKYLTGVDQSGTDPVTIATTTTFSARKLIAPDLLAYDYVVYKSGSTYYALAQDGTTTSNSNFVTLINGLITALTSGGSIFIRGGSYDVPSTITINNKNIMIKGAGRGLTTLVRTTSGSNTDMMDILATSYVEVSNLTFNENYPTNTSQSGNNGGAIYISNPAEAYFSNLEIKSFAGRQAAFNASKATFDNCRIVGPNPNVTGNGLWGIHSGAENSIPPTNVIRNCYFAYCDLNALALRGYSMVENCTFELNARANGGQIWSNDTSDGFGGIYTEIRGCVLKQGMAGAQGIETCSGQWVVTDNYIEKQVYGIIIAAYSGFNNNPGPVTVSNNIVKNNTFVGIDIRGSPGHTVISGNVCFDDQGGSATQTRGIYTEDTTLTADKYIITNNICYGNTVQQIHDTATGTNKVVSGNLTV